MKIFSQTGMQFVLKRNREVEFILFGDFLRVSGNAASERCNLKGRLLKF